MAERAFDVDATFADLVAALTGEPLGSGADVDVRVDPGRDRRKGAPEVVLATGKTAAQIVEAVSGLLSARGRVLVSRAGDDLMPELGRCFGSDNVRGTPGGRTIVVAAAGVRPPCTGGRVGVITAGASDWPAADEARLAAEEMGCAVRLITDVGVAGLHRLFPPLRGLLAEGVDVIVVAAGMDGALPSVVAGLVPVPVIGLPTAIGYGAGGRGEAALLSMLQTCAPGLTVVNIDNGIGAGISAGMIANAIAAARARAGT